MVALNLQARMHPGKVGERELIGDDQQWKGAGLMQWNKGVGFAAWEPHHG